jgi:hypothetical protein
MRVLRRIFGLRRNEVNENNEVKEDEMGRVCSTNWGEQERV